MKKQIRKIISGGQTGVDRGALDAALAAGVECGGFCPRGRIAEDGTIPDRYPLVEMAEGGYFERTARNVAEADATVILAFGPLSGGTLQTVEECRRQHKPHIIIDARACGVDRAVTQARGFIERFQIRCLNVAGPRASEAPDACDVASRIVAGLLS